ncbi:hypothetical protein MPTA6425_1610 [Mycoplasmoides pneumoniae]|nr:hypothetical protein Y1241N_1580 [Mycoplasmoides pneumoniae]GLL60264.1 hypothetical protein OA571N_1460 [Mycoplasmoides pneumoniae]GLL60998.1 hypothetical protein OA631U_1610 [Mycoplasmoides pneumoniae]
MVSLIRLFKLAPTLTLEQALNNKAENNNGVDRYLNFIRGLNKPDIAVNLLCNQSKFYLPLFQ